MAKLLVVEDDLDSALLVEATFEGSPHEVILVEDPRQAIETASRHEIDVVILDIMMPGASGFEVLRELREQESTAEVPILVLSSLASSENRVQGLRLGAADYLTKPFDPDELLLRVENLVQQNDLEEAALEGRLEDFPSWELLQSLQQSARSGLLTLRERGARLIVYQGHVADATFGNLTGREAALAISSLESGRFKFSPPELENIQMSRQSLFSVRGLLMEAALLRDELDRRRQFLPSPDLPLRAKPRELPPLPESFEDVPVGRVFLELVQNPRLSLNHLRERLSLCSQKIDLSLAWLVETTVVQPEAVAPTLDPVAPEVPRGSEPGPRSRRPPPPNRIDEARTIPSRQILVFMESGENRRQSIAKGLARFGYEVIPAVSAQEGANYLKALSPSIVVMPSEWVKHPALAPLLERQTNLNRSIVALGDQKAEPNLPRWIQFLSTSELTPDSFLERLRLLLLGRELGIDVDSEFESLVGELSQHPLPELLRGLQKAQADGWLELTTGILYLSEGKVVYAACPPVDGLKAFCRLGREHRGPFHFRTGRPPTANNIQISLDDALKAARDEGNIELLDPRTRILVEMGPRFFSTRFTELQQEILSAAHEGATADQLLDSIEKLDGEVLEELLRLEQLGLVVLEKPLDQVCILTDSTADLPEGEARNLGIQVVPLRVTFGDESFHDGLELTPRGFYQRLQTSPHHPFTTPPSVEAFAHQYRSILGDRDIVSLHISERIPSETVANARTAAQQARAQTPSQRSGSDLPSLEVVDSQQTSAPLGLLTIFAARMAHRGLKTSEIVERIKDMSGRLETLFVVDTLEYLAKGGRVGKASAWVGKMLDIKPILGLENGRIVPVDKVRGGRRAQKRILELFQQRLDKDLPCILCVGHAMAPVWADRLAHMMVERFSVTESFLTEMGPVIGTHVGPGTVGAVVLQPREDEVDLLTSPH